MLCSDKTIPKESSVLTEDNTKGMFCSDRRKSPKECSVLTEDNTKEIFCSDRR
jgi:hypothetical protein